MGRLKMQKETISIIIPAFNCEKYLARCLDSVLNQSYKNLEVILINDGSTDSTALICQKYAKTDKRICYFEQKNQGVAYTRKIGIGLASGRYIGFVDADDYIDITMYDEMYSCMSKAQLVTSGYISEKEVFDLMPPGLYYTKKEMEYFYSNMLVFEDTKKIGISTNLWTKLFLADKLKEASKTVQTDIFIGEDVDLLFRYILLCDSIYVSNICSYHYNKNSLSLTNTVNKDYLRNINSLYFSLEKVFMESEYKDILLTKWALWIWQMIQNVPQFMGWTIINEKRSIHYLNPYMNLLKDKKIILYGAGVVGKDFYKLNDKIKEIQIVLWTDTNWKNLQGKDFLIQPIDQIFSVEFDFILIAVKDHKKASEIKLWLIKNGISDSKILWKKPIKLDD